MDRRTSENPIARPGHATTRLVLRVAGPLLLAAGLALVAIGVGSFFATIASFGGDDFGPPRYFWCAFLGIPVLWLGAVTTGAGYLGAANRYVAGEVAPVQKDTFNYLAEGARPGVRALAEAVGEGLSGGAACPRCRAGLPAGARFCPGCGASFAAETCGRCGVQAAPGAKFCHGCGAPLRITELA